MTWSEGRENLAVRPTAEHGWLRKADFKVVRPKAEACSGQKAEKTLLSGQRQNTVGCGRQISRSSGQSGGMLWAEGRENLAVRPIAEHGWLRKADCEVAGPKRRRDPGRRQ